MESNKGGTPIMFTRILSHYAQITSRVALVTVGTVALLAIPAYYLDDYLGTKPKFFVAALIISLPLVQFITYKVIKAYVNSNPMKR